MNPQVISRYFSLDAAKIAQFDQLGALYADWNDKINVISRKDIDNLYERHVLHSLVIAAFWGPLKDGTKVLDLGTGGGFPGIPLAVFYPNVRFHLVDRIAKKLRVASEVAKAIGLSNVTFQHGDIGECHEKFDYVVSRAVMPLDKLVKLCRPNICSKSVNRYANGLVCLKGGDLEQESQGISFPIVEYDVKEFVNHEGFEDKKLVYVPMTSKKK